MSFKLRNCVLYAKVSVIREEENSSGEVVNGAIQRSLMETTNQRTAFWFGFRHKRLHVDERRYLNIEPTVCISV